LLNVYRHVVLTGITDLERVGGIFRWVCLLLVIRKCSTPFRMFI